MVGIQLASARIGRITGRGLTENFARICPAWLVRILVSLLVIANVINLGADLNAMGDAARMVLHGPAAVYTIGLGMVSLLLQVFVPYRRYVSVLKWLTLSLMAYIGVVFTVHVDWVAAVRGMIWPQAQWNKDYVTTVVAILGTTISPYLFFWQAAQEVEEIHRVPEDQPLRRAPEQQKKQLRRLRIDTIVGMGFSNLIAFFMITAAAATLHQKGIQNIETTSQAAEALRPIAGDLTFWLFAAGVVGTGLLALPVLAGSAAYAVASLIGVRKGLDRPAPSARAFYAILAAAMVRGIGIGIAGFKPIQALFWAAVINVVISVPIMVAVMIAASTPKLVGTMPLGLRWKVLGWGATGVMAAATNAMFGTMAM